MSMLVVLALAVAMALATSLFGWWGVPLTAALVSGARATLGRRTRPATPARVALGAALAWAGLLAWAAAGGRFGAVLALVERVAGAPAPVVVALTLLLPAVLAWAAATLVETIVAAVRPRAPDPITLPAPGPPGRPAESSAPSTAAATP
jgi:hypothetical protein